MKKIAIAIIMILGAALYSQQPTNNGSAGAPAEQKYVKAEDYNRVLSAFTETALQKVDLEKENAVMLETINYARALVTDISKVNTIEELDQVRNKYQIPKPEKGKSNDKQGNKTSGK